LDILFFNHFILKNTGQERFRSITQSYYRKADGIMLLFDVSNERSFLNIRHWADCLADCLSRDHLNLPLVVCGTKADLRPSSANQGLSCVQPIQAQRLAAQLKAQYIETSAKTGSNLLEALVILTRFSHNLSSFLSSCSSTFNPISFHSKKKKKIQADDDRAR
jgi:GTPase SAR1 family protein